MCVCVYKKDCFGVTSTDSRVDLCSVFTVNITLPLPLSFSLCHSPSLPLCGHLPCVTWGALNFSFLSFGLFFLSWQGLCPQGGVGAEQSPSFSPPFLCSSPSFILFPPRTLPLSFSFSLSLSPFLSLCRSQFNSVLP